MLLFGGYRRITKKNVLEQDARNTLYRAISNNPGIDVPTLAGITGLNENTIRYHLVKLIENGKVTYLVKPGVIRYFLNQGAYSPYEQVFIHYLWSETSSRNHPSAQTHAWPDTTTDLRFPWDIRSFCHPADGSHGRRPGHRKPLSREVESLLPHR